MTGRCVVTIACLTLIVTSAIAEEDPVIAAARKRQEAAKTLTFEIKTTTYLLKGGPPAEETKEFEHTTQYVIDGEKIRRELDARQFVKGFDPHRWHDLSVFDGTLTKHLSSSPTIPGRMGGTIQDDDPPSIGIPQPMAITYRSLGRLSHYGELVRMKSTGNKETIDGATCLEYVTASGQITGTYWFDADKGLVLRRHVARGKRGIERQLDVRYRNQGEIGWVPAGWTDLSRLGGINHRREEAEVLRVDFNETQAAAQFEVTFPPGTQLFDERDHKTYQIALDGSQRLTHVNGVPTPWHVRNRWISYAALGTLLLLGAVMFGIRSLRKKPK